MIIPTGGGATLSAEKSLELAVKNFLMNDKCAAGTGRFLEMMARTLGLSLEEKLGAKLYICDEAQLCGALGAALFAGEKCRQQDKEEK